YIVLEYILSDKDGDLEGDTTVQDANTARSIVIYYHKNGEWHSMNAVSTVDITPQTAIGGKSTFKIQIPTQAAGADSIGAAFVARTQFGDPNGNTWYKLPNLFSGVENLGSGEEGDQNTGEKPGEDNPGEVCGVVGAPSCGNGSEIDTDVKPVCPAGETLNQQECGGPIEAAGVVEYIYQVVNGTVDTSIDYVTADVNPQVGNEYILSVFDTEKNKDITE